MFNKGKLIVIIISSIVVLYTVIGGFLGKAIAEDDTYKNLSIFQDIYKKIVTEYVEHPQLELITEGALQGLVAGVDYYSCYLTPDEYTFVNEKFSLQGETGIILTPRIGYYRVLQVLPGSPAEESGINPGDVIEEIDGAGVSEKSFIYATASLRGEPGTVVVLGLNRGRVEELTEVSIKRSLIATVPIESKILREGVGLVKVLQFHPDSPAEMEKVLNTLVSSGISRMILDLRFCSTGSYNAAVKISDMFIDSGIITSQTGSDTSETTFTASPQNTLFKGAIVILTNGYTSGPAEIVAAALKEQPFTKVVGLKTYGTASMQKYFKLDDGSAIYLTHQLFRSPTGDTIWNEKFNKAGVRPDLKSPEDDFSLSLYVDYEMATGADAQKYYRIYIDAVYQKQLEDALNALQSISVSMEKVA